MLETFALTFVLLAGGAATRAMWHFGYGCLYGYYDCLKRGKGQEYEIAAPDVWIGPGTRVGEAQASYNDALRGAHKAVLAASISVDEAEENLRRRHETASIPISDSGVIGAVCVGAHCHSTTVMRC